jgi:hypothetical protein
MRAFEKNVVVRVGARFDRLRGLHPKAFLADSLQRSGYDIFVAREPGPADYFFVLGINISADAQLNSSGGDQQEYRRRRPERL